MYKMSLAIPQPFPEIMNSPCSDSEYSFCFLCNEKAFAISAVETLSDSNVSKIIDSFSGACQCLACNSVVASISIRIFTIFWNKASVLVIAISITTVVKEFSLCLDYADFLDAL